MPDEKHFGRHIRAGRALALLTQKGLVRALKSTGVTVDPATVSLWERGERYPSHLQFSHLCGVLGWSGAKKDEMERLKLSEEASA